MFSEYSLSYNPRAFHRYRCLSYSFPYVPLRLSILLQIISQILCFLNFLYVFLCSFPFFFILHLPLSNTIILDLSELKFNPLFSKDLLNLFIISFSSDSLFANRTCYPRMKLSKIFPRLALFLLTVPFSFFLPSLLHIK